MTRNNQWVLLCGLTAVLFLTVQPLRAQGFQLGIGLSTFSPAGGAHAYLDKGGKYRLDGLTSFDGKNWLFSGDARPIPLGSKGQLGGGLTIAGMENANALANAQDTLLIRPHLSLAVAPQVKGDWSFQGGTTIGPVLKKTKTLDFKFNLKVGLWANVAWKGAFLDWHWWGYPGLSCLTLGYRFDL